MKFQKGLLDDLKRASTPREREVVEPRKEITSSRPAEDDDRLFQTHHRTSRSWKQHFVMLSVIAFMVAIAGSLVFYFTLPSRGDQVRPPRGLEAAIRDHFLDVEKRNAGEIAFYYCESFYWARVEVERRPDIKTNPIYQIGSYAARAFEANGAGWKINATPITSRELDVPCN